VYTKPGALHLHDARALDRERTERVSQVVKAQRLKPSRLTGSDEPPAQRGGVEVAGGVARKDGSSRPVA